MHKPVLIIGLVGALALPAVAQATDTPTAADRQSASKECRFERGSTAATREAFSAKYGTNKNKANAFGKCVSAKAREEVKEREDAEGSAAQTCKTERGTTAESEAAFAAEVRHQQEQEQRVRQVRLGRRHAGERSGRRA